MVRVEAKVACVFHFGKVKINLTPGTSIQNGILVYCGRNTVDGISTEFRNALPRIVNSAVDTSQLYSERIKTTYYWHLVREDV